MTVDGLGLVIVGLAAIALGSAAAKKRVIAAYGRVDAETRERAEEDGVVPGWATALVLLGYLGIVVGVVLAGIGFIRR